MVSALDSGSSGPGRVLAGDIVLCSWASHCCIHTGILYLVFYTLDIENPSNKFTI